MADETTIGELLREFRKREGYTQKELAKLIGYDNSVVSRVERGRQPPSRQYLERLSESLALSVSDQGRMAALLQQEADKAISALLSSPEASCRIDWGEAPDVRTFYGRQEKLARLEQWVLADHCRLIGVLGMGGIGKTVLVAKLIERIKDRFDYFIWRSLRNAPPIERVLRDFVAHLSDRQESQPSGSIGEGISQLIELLRNRRCLLVLDGVEAILCEGEYAGHYRQGCEEYGPLFQRVGEATHPSCLVLTSREKPKEFGPLEGEASPVRSLQLTGLKPAQGKEVLKDRGLFGSDDAWASLVDRYLGNPWIMMTVAETIRELFAGDIECFLKEEAPILGGVRDLLDRQFDRLSKLEQDVICWLAIEREPVSLDCLCENLIGRVSKEELLDALTSLRRRSLVEKSAQAFTLHDMFMTYVITQLIDQVYEEIVVETISLFQSHALMKAQTQDYLREAQVRLILRPLADRLLNSLGKKTIEDKLLRILSTLREVHPRQPGYAGGNILNLLVELGGELSNRDFSHLTIWQADLRGVDLHGTRFICSDLNGTVFSETFGKIYTAAIRSDVGLIGAGSVDCEVHIWRVSDGKKLFTCRGHTDWVESIAFNPDGSRLASAGEDQTIRLWDVSTGDCVRVLKGRTGIPAIAFSSDGNFLASSGRDGAIQLWDLSNGQCLRVLQGPTDHLTTIAFSPNNLVLASGGYGHVVRLWDVESSQCLVTLEGHIDRVWSITFKPEGDMLASASEDQTVRLWDIGTGQCIRTLCGHAGPVRGVAFSADGDKLVSGGVDQSVKLWDVRTGRCLKTLLGHTNWIRSVAFGSDGKTIVSGGDDNTVRLWAADTGQVLKTLHGYTNSIRIVAFSPSGTLLASGSDDQVVRFWDVSRDHCYKALRGHTNWIWSMAFSPDGGLLASVGEDKLMMLWNVQTGRCFRKIRLADWVRSIAFSPNGKTIACASESKTLDLWDIDTGQCYKSLSGHQGWLESVAFSPDGSKLASAGNDSTIRLWDADTGECLQALQGHSARVLAVTFSPDGGTLASGGDETVRLWDSATGWHLDTLEGHTDWVWSVAFNPDGSMLASSGGDKTIRLWDVKTRRCLEVLHGHSDRIRSVAFSPDGCILASGSDDETIRFWDVHKGDCLSTLRADRPYERMDITGATGLTEVQKATLRDLGAVEELVWN